MLVDYGHRLNFIGSVYGWWTCGYYIDGFQMTAADAENWRRIAEPKLIKRFWRYLGAM
jgi:hypothetical protein